MTKWEYISDPQLTDSQHVIAIASGVLHGFRIAVVDSNWPNEALARHCTTIAAAPELLAACESLIAQYDAPGGPAITAQVNDMRAAIAKAKGGAA